jgi:fatty-acyl-CoA synthase
MKTETATFSLNATTRVFTEDGQEVRPGSGDVGVVANGGLVPIGYYKDPEKSARTFRTFDGVTYSVPGDWATVEEDGTINLLGRGSVSINSGGEKIYPEEVEEAVKGAPGVADCVVVGVPDDRFGEAVTAVVAPDPDADLDPAKVKTAGDSLARFKRPRHVVIVDKIPRGPNGKADYAWAKETAAAHVSRGG